MSMKERESIARIDVARAGNPPVRGTGVLVARELVLTALHVVADRQQSPPVFFQGPICLTFPGKTVKAVAVEGMWDEKEDWVLLRCTEPPDCPHLPLGELEAHEQGLPWTTFGFPDANPADGMVMAGRVRDSNGRYLGIPAIQLFSNEAAAGNGAPVAGLSGAPCLVEGAVVGVMRSSLLKGALAVAGTLYACPTRFVLDKAEGLLPLVDPCRGLPGLPRRNLPPNPYRSLERYTEADAELFFGRSADIRSLYLHLVDPDSAAITLLFGQSGVGKSSLLEAGLIPRLRSQFFVRHVRRDAARRLHVCLEEATSGDWIALEKQEQRPVLIILDQVEESFTRPLGDPQDEWARLMTALGALFGPQGRRPRGRLILAFRKEWLADIRNRLLASKLFFFEYFLRRLGAETPQEIIEVVHGITRTERLRKYYRARFDPELGRTIADDLLEDPGSPVAPTLQILVLRLWEQARKDSPNEPAMTKANYLVLKQQGLHLEDFLRQALVRLPREVQPQVASGLVDDVLEAHTTVYGTAGTRTRAALGARYQTLRPEALDQLLRALEHEYLLTNPDKDPEVRDTARTRLSHDTLAPLVRERFRTSTQPGQRARRILESRTAEQKDTQSERKLNGLDLQLVEQGLAGMRVPTPEEDALLEVSRRARARWRRARVLGFAGGAGLLAFLLWFYTSRYQELALKQQTETRLYSELAFSASDPVQALEYMTRAIDAAPEDDPRLSLYITHALHLFTQVAPARLQVSQQPIEYAELSQDGRHLLLQGLDQQVKVIEFDARDAKSGFEKKTERLLSDGSDSTSKPRISPDGRWVLTVTSKSNEDDVYYRLQVWEVATASSVFSNYVGWSERDFSFTPDSRAILAHHGSKQVSVFARLNEKWLAVAEGKKWQTPKTGAQSTLASPSFAVDSHVQGDQLRMNVVDIASGQAAFPGGGRVFDKKQGWPRPDAPAENFWLSRSGTLGASMFVGHETAWAETWDFRTGQPIARMQMPFAAIPTIIAVSEDGKDLLSG